MAAYSAEVFVNDGEQVMTVTFMTDIAAKGISFFADGQVEMDITKYDLYYFYFVVRAGADIKIDAPQNEGGYQHTQARHLSLHMQ